MNEHHPIWHPFTQMKLAATPIHIERAKDCTLYSTDGKTYIDAISSWWVNIHGHCNELIAKAIAHQATELEHVIFAGFTHSPAITLAENLIAILPKGFAKIFYSDDGSTAVEVAIKMAFQFWHNQGVTSKTKIIAFKDAYHGDTFGAMSAGERSVFTAPFHSHLFDVHFIPVPNKNNNADVKQALLQLAKSGEIAAFIYEPLVQGAAGMLMYEPHYLDELIHIAKQNNILCIADEVMTGFGRTGKNFASDHLNNSPDLICLSKGITGGFMPLGVTACTQRIYGVFHSAEMAKTFFHGHSYTANPLACAAANASLKILLSDKCQLQIKAITALHRKFSLEIKNHKAVKEVRQLGTILAMELQTDEKTSYFNSIRNSIYSFFLDEGVLLRPLGNIIYIMPPYCITEAELAKVYAAILKAVQQMELA